MSQLLFLLLSLAGTALVVAAAVLLYLPFGLFVGGVACLHLARQIVEVE